MARNLSTSERTLPGLQYMISRTSSISASWVDSLDQRHLHALDRGQRLLQHLPLLAAVASDPQLPRRRAEVERRGLRLVDVHRVTQHREVALLLRQALRQL